MDDKTQALASARLWYGDPREIVPALVLAKESRPVRSEAVADEGPYGDGVAVARLANGIAMAHLDGPMMPYFTSGGTDTRAMASLIQRLAADEDVRAIMLDVDSPGGDVEGTDDLAIAVRQAAAAKPVAAHVSSKAASAAYYVASQAPVVTMGRTTMVGSIGVYSMLVDDSRFWEDMGFKIRLVSSGGIKGVGAPGQPVTDDDAAVVQEIVDRYYGFFVEAVAAGRGMDENQVRGIEQGRMFGADAAIENGLADAIMSRGDALAALHARGVERAQRAAVVARVRGNF